MKALLRRDPGTFVLAFAVWAAVNGISLVLPGDAFEISQVYGEVARLGIVERWIGAAMLVL